MTWYTDLQPVFRYFLAGFLFFACFAELSLCLYQFHCTGKWINCLKNFFIFFLLLIFLTYITAASKEGQVVHKIFLPWFFLPLVSFVVLLYSFWGIRQEYKKGRQNLSPSSIKESLDHLEMGVCFADSTGRILLINYTMVDLISSILGSYPQMYCEIETALEHLKMENLKTLEEKSGNTDTSFYRFPDGRLWQFRFSTLTKDQMKGFIQITAGDVTKIYEANEALEKENENLKTLNEKLQAMQVQLADQIREEETLNLKMRIHNEIGTSLLSLSNLMQENNQKDVDNQLHILQNAIRFFYDDRMAAWKTFEDIRKKAKEMGVECFFEGFFPESEETRSLIALASIECVTNCIKHAGGNQVLVQIRRYKDQFLVKITNNGEKPKQEIKMGGGLSAIQKTIERAGGNMQIISQPEFAIILTLNDNNVEK